MIATPIQRRLRALATEEAQRDKVFHAMFPGQAGSIIRRAFDLMGVAETEIAAFKRRHQAVAARINAAFGILVSTSEDMTLAADPVYRFHARELLTRVVAEQDTRPGTLSECMLALSRTSLKAPLDRNAAAAYARIFVQAFPDRADAAADLQDESWPGAVDELLTDLRRKLTRMDRVL